MRTGSLPFLVGGGALAAHVWSRSRRADVSAEDVTGRDAPRVPVVVEAPGTWVWPVPTWNGRRAAISDGFGSPRPGGARHDGVDLMFARTPGDPYRAGSSNASLHFVMPDDHVALAAADGVIRSAGWTDRGYSVVIDHAPQAPLATYYTHLALLLVPPTVRKEGHARVHAGQPIGIIGADPLDAAHLKHLHFALWREGNPHDPIDPAPLLRRWPHLDDPRHAMAARNAALVYRPVGDRGDDYPAWVRDLRDKSGVYVIRQRGDDGEPVVVYVGESHSGSLYETLTRHFQIWRRWKGFWQGQYGQGHDPGMTYDRGSVEVAVRVLPANRALDEEARLIRRLRPRDNLIGQPALEDAPF
jgi:Peptidase family M23